MKQIMCVLILSSISNLTYSMEKEYPVTDVFQERAHIKKTDISSYKELIKQDCIHLMGGCVVYLAIVCYYVYELYGQNAEGLA